MGCKAIDCIQFNAYGVYYFPLNNFFLKLGGGDRSVPKCPEYILLKKKDKRLDLNSVF